MADDPAAEAASAGAEELLATVSNLSQICGFAAWGSWSACTCSEGYSIATRSRQRSVAWQSPIAHDGLCSRPVFTKEAHFCSSECSTGTTSPTVATVRCE